MTVGIPTFQTPVDRWPYQSTVHREAQHVCVCTRSALSNDFDASMNLSFWVRLDLKVKRCQDMTQCWESVLEWYDLHDPSEPGWWKRRSLLQRRLCLLVPSPDLVPCEGECEQISEEGRGWLQIICPDACEIFGPHFFAGSSRIGPLAPSSSGLPIEEGRGVILDPYSG